MKLQKQKRNIEDGREGSETGDGEISRRVLCEFRYRRMDVN